MLTYQPLKGLINEAVNAVLEDCQRHGSNALFILIGGSVAEGVAVSTSDVDLVLVQSNKVDVRVKQFVLKGYWIEVKVYNLVEFRNVVGMVKQGCAGPTFFRQLDSRRRFLFSKAVYGADKYCKEMKSAKVNDFLDDLLEFQQAEILKNFIDTDGALQDSLHEDDIRIRARKYLESSVDALLTSAGDYYFRPKWIMARIRRTFVGDLMTSLQEPISALISGRSFDDSVEVGSWVKRVLSYSAVCQYLATFKGEGIAYLNSNDIKNFESNLSLHIPLLIARRGERILIRTNKSALELSPVLANVFFLSTFGMDIERTNAIIFKLTKGKLSKDEIGVLLFEVTRAKKKLGIN